MKAASHHLDGCCVSAQGAVCACVCICVCVMAAVPQHKVLCAVLCVCVHVWALPCVCVCVRVCVCGPRHFSADKGTCVSMQQLPLLLGRVFWGQDTLT